MDITTWTKRCKYNKNNPLPAGYNHEWGAKYTSNWDYIKTEFSNYHFDKFQVEQEGDYWARLGRFEGDFAQAAEEIVEKSKELNWEELTAKGLRGFGPYGSAAPMKQQEDYDRANVHNLPHNNYTNLVMDTDLPRWPVVQAMVDFWKLEVCKPRVQVQMPGDVFAVHMDKLWHNCPEEPERIIRIHVMLQDWEPGQSLWYGNSVLHQWRAGDIHTFDHWNTPHSTANLSSKARPMLSIIGNRTARTDEILAQARADSVYPI